MSFRVVIAPSGPVVFADTEQTLATSLRHSMFDVTSPVEAGLEQISDHLYRVILLSVNKPDLLLETGTKILTKKGRRPFSLVRTTNALEQTELALQYWGLDTAPVMSTEGEELIAPRDLIVDACMALGVDYTSHLAFFQRNRQSQQ